MSLRYISFIFARRSILARFLQGLSPAFFVVSKRYVAALEAAVFYTNQKCFKKILFLARKSTKKKRYVASICARRQYPTFLYRTTLKYCFQNDHAVCLVALCLQKTALQKRSKVTRASDKCRREIL